MKIIEVDHSTMEIEAESVAEHLFIVQFHDAIARLILPKPFAFNACKLEIKVRPDPQEAKVEQQLGI